MKKMLLIWLLAAGFASAGATAQNIALGERVPELKIQTWLDNRQPEPAPTTYIEFFHSTSVMACERVVMLPARMPSTYSPVESTRFLRRLK